MNIGYILLSDEEASVNQHLETLSQEPIDIICLDKKQDECDHLPGLHNCLMKLKSGDTLVVGCLDCLADSIKMLIAVLKSLHEKGVGLISVSDSLVVTAETLGIFIFHLQCFGKYECCITKQGSKASSTTVRPRGRNGGRKPAMSSSDVSKAVDMLSHSNKSKIEVAEHFSVSRTTLNASLKRDGFQL